MKYFILNNFFTLSMMILPESSFAIYMKHCTWKNLRLKEFGCCFNVIANYFRLANLNTSSVNFFATPINPSAVFIVVRRSDLNDKVQQQENEKNLSGIHSGCSGSDVLSIVGPKILRHLPKLSNLKPFLQM